jgi:tetratricopeptide (TPR) repeat protein
LLAAIPCLTLLVAADSPRAPEKPVGIVVSAEGSVLVDTHRSETSWTAAPGILLFPGFTLRNVNGSVRFSFCPGNSDFTLDRGASVTLRAERIDGQGVASAGHPSFCQVPVMTGTSTRGESPPEQPLTPERQAELTTRLQPVEAALAARPGDLNAHMTRISLLQEFGRTQELLAAREALAAVSPDATWTRGVKPAAPPAAPRDDPGKVYALVVGISAYKYLPPAPLQFADKDAELFVKLLSLPRSDGRKVADEIRLLLNEHATRAAIEGEVERLAKENAGSPKSNTLLLYLAGHGAYPETQIDPISHRAIEREPYILTYDSQTQDLKTTAYPMQDFRSLVAAQAAHFGRVLVFVDVCHSNQIGTVTSDLKLPAAVQEVFNGHQGEFGMMVATKNLAFESELFGNGHGAFTYFLVDGWNGGAAPDSSKLEFEDLFDYVKRGVRKVTNQAQTPESQNPSPNLVVTAAIDPASKLHLDPAVPLPPSATSAYRGLQTGPGKASIAAGAHEARPAKSAPRSFDEAIAQGVLLRGEPGNAIGYFEAVRTSATAEQLGDMRDRLRVALEDRGQETILRYLEGNQIPQVKDDFIKGGDYFKEALHLAPDSVFDEARMLFCRGRAAIFDHGYAEARVLLERSIRLDPNHGYAYNALGISLLEQTAAGGSTYDDAVRAFHDAIRFAPYWAYPRHNLALTYEQAGDYAAAERTYLEAIALGRQYSYLYYNVAMLYQRLNRLPLAERYYLSAKDAAVRNLHVTETPAGPRSIELGEAWDALGTVDSERGRWSKAEGDYRKALAADPQSLNARHNLALLLSRSTASKEAEALWEQNLAGETPHLPSMLAYGDYLARGGSTERAVAVYERVAALRADYSGVHRKLAAIWIQQKEPGKALEELRRAAKSAPGNPELLEQIGDLEERLGNREAALTAWQEAGKNATDSGMRKRLLKRVSTLPSSRSLKTASTDTRQDP